MTRPVLQYRVSSSLPEAEAAVRQALQEEGFGILTEVDVTSVLRQKLGIETRPQKLLGACNPRIAHASLNVDPDVGAYLPCGISLREGAAADETIVSLQNPSMISEAFEEEALKSPAGEASRKLDAALRRVGSAM